MKTHVKLKIYSDKYEVRLIIDGMTSYWAVAVHQQIQYAEEALSKRFSEIGCTFGMDLNAFFEKNDNVLVFGGEIGSKSSADMHRIRIAMETTANYLAKKLGLEIMLMEFERK